MDSSTSTSGGSALREPTRRGSDGPGGLGVWGLGRARALGRVQRAGKVQGLLPIRRLRFLGGRRHLPARPGSGSGEPRCQETPRRRGRGGSGAGRGSSRSGVAAARVRGSSCLGAAGQEQSLGRGWGGHSPRVAGSGCSSAAGEVPVEGETLFLTGLFFSAVQRPRPERWRTTTSWK